MARRVWEEARARAKVDALSRGTLPGRAVDLPLDIVIASFWTDRVLFHEQKGQSDIWARLKKVSAAFGKDTLVSTIDDAMIFEWLKRRREHISDRTRRALSKIYVNGEVSDIQKVLNFARTELKIELPIINWKKFKIAKTKLPKRSRVLMPDEWLQVLKTIRPDYRPIIMFVLSTGMRLESLVDLRWSNINWLTKTIRFRQKGDSFHTIVITSDVDAILRTEEAYKAGPEGHVFTFISKLDRVNPSNNEVYTRGQRYPISYYGLSTEWRRFSAKLDMPHATIHDLRKTFATYFAIATDVESASEALGHSPGSKVALEDYVFIPAPRKVVVAEMAARVRRELLLGTLDWGAKENERKAALQASPIVVNESLMCAQDDRPIIETGSGAR